MIDRPNTKMSIYKESTGSEPITTSFGYNSGQGELLVVRGLKPSTKYIIVMEFNLVDNYDEFETEPCQYFRMSILTTSDKDQCLK